MSKVKFTKGPWSIEQQNKINWILSAEDNFNKAVAKVTKYGSSDTDVMNANAHLISAAPEMYELLEDYVSFVERGDAEGFNQMFCVVKELLSKARGEL